ncbi:MAG: hypothetical protein F6K40_29410 [Okeania sp. SIO3I5]|uniref:hypothetical protein n=1 Tax=Okeania sp. SIO3I5 TaxID=2607805 RepID=UPI0013B80C16|nr:hypothetical protein [Okeania sp. SIO3I5]NEQ40137.1 hypothetical protein [Okeania sp. SIO3I5]
MVEPITTLLIGKWILTHLGIHGASAATATAVGTPAAITAVGALIYISYLTVNALVNWFQARTYIATKPEHVAASYQTNLKSGKTVIVQGIFKKNTGSLVEGRTIQYDSLQSEVRKLHDDDRTVIWE